MKKKFASILVLLLSLLAITSLSFACAPSTPDNGVEGQTPPQHTHEYSTEYKYDNDYHWFECECGEDKGNAPHSLIDGKCACGYNKLQSGHTHTAGEWIIETPATCTRVGYRFKKCTDCGSVVETGQIDYAAHDYVYGECSVCSAIDSTYMTEGLLFGLNESEDGYWVKSYSGTAVDIIIPEIYRGKPVVGVYEGAFRLGDQGMPIVSVVIPAGSIEYCAFYNCVNLKRVELGDKVTSIGDEAFSGCHNLESVTLSDNIVSIDFFAFDGCDKLQFNEKDGAKYLGSATNMYICLYEGISGDIIVNDGCKYARQGAFLSSEITSLTIPKSIINLHNAFDSPMAGAVCGRGITRIDVDEDNAYYKSIDGNLYSKDGKVLLKYAIGNTAIEFTIPDGVTSIGEEAFYWCYSLTSIVIGDSVKEIGSYAFYSCSSLTSVEIGDSVESIGTEAFYDCDSLTSVVIGDSVTSVGSYAFYSCDSLTSVVIGDSVKDIGDWAFYYCYSLTSVVIPDSVTSIGEGAFSNQSSLTIYCEAESKPDGWNESWYISWNTFLTVVWGYKG